MNIYTKKGALAAAAAIFAISAAPVQADHFATGMVYDADGNIMYITCESFGGLKYTLDNEVTFVNDAPDQKDRVALNGKLTEAHDKLHEDPPKNCDAAQKLDDFNTKVVALRDGGKGGKPKIFDETNGDAIACLVDGSAKLAASLTDGITCEAAGDPPRGKGPK
jgi:hypothetical protein